jgi:integrase
MIDSTQAHSVNYPSYKPIEKEDCMIGDIYTRELCPICGGKYSKDDKKGFYCPVHPEQRPRTMFLRFKDIFKNYNNYDKARKKLISLQVKVEDGEFDPRDYKKDNPLGFDTLAEGYKKFQAGEVESLRTIVYHMDLAIEYWHGKNIKTIQYAELEDFLLAKTDRAKEVVGHLSEKSRANLKATLHAFWKRLRIRRVITKEQFPDFPIVPYSFKRRKLIDKPTQLAVIEQIKKATERNPKIHLAISLLKTYFSIRPSEMLRIKEGDFDFDLGGVWIQRPKSPKREKEPRFVAFIPVDLRRIKEFQSKYPALPETYFFRHEVGYGGVKPGSKMGRDCLYKAWRSACVVLGVVGVPLYPGTKHSSVTDLRKTHKLTPEEIQRASQIKSNKAFKPYLDFDLDESLEIFSLSSGVNLAPVSHRKILPLKKGKTTK